MRQIKNVKEKLCFLAGVALMYLLMYLLDTTCLIKSAVGICCPGCGMSRALLAAFRLDFLSAVALHPLFWTVPLIILYILFDGELLGKIADRIILSVLLSGFVCVWILRLCGVLPTP